MAKQIVTLGIGASDSLTPFITTGLGVGAAVAAVLVVYEAFAYSQGTPAASVIEALSPAVSLKTNLSPAADVIQALSPDGNTRTNATPGAEVNSS